MYSFSKHIVVYGNYLHLDGIIWTNKATCQKLIYKSQYVCYNVRYVCII